ncbi:MAG: tRNA (adenosine(37)-N6)-threonylcarbamoyltransferase complex transferase subunit TsaD [Candidatus Krumholzibacteria bacterium]|nr:tRNA (adenosine(37)-N6)-threonylcarbamoyltransferase complex transferase subunit TsaD [Candidatus Krumholzibacteria bacterium]
MSGGNAGKLYLGIETSCDDTSCTIFSSGRGILSYRTASQLDHARYGGVVPEIASRTHMRTLLPVWESVMEEAGVSLGALAGIGVTHGPGLTGSLLVGLSFAKSLAWAGGVPLAGVHHIEGHILANAIEGPLTTPAVVLVVSGGHTQLFNVARVGRYELLGQTRDDAAGEAFDKIGKILGLPYPGGPAVEVAARGGDPGAFDLPRGLKGSGECDFSFSGLKTAVRLLTQSIGALSPAAVADIAASAQEAIVDALARKSVLALERTGAERLYLAGGVAANRRLREVMRERLRRLGATVGWPPPRYCTDNAAMIACAARHHLEAGRRDGLDLNTFPRGVLASWA